MTRQTEQERVDRLVLDRQARQRALDPRSSFLVQAPAGSGKTTLLVARYLALLATVEHPEEIVALTFTRKAATEMEQRILHALRTAEESGGPEELGELARRAREQARRRGWDDDELPLRLRVQTIDQLALGIVRRLPWHGPTGVTPAGTEDVEDFYRMAARRLMLDLDGGDELAGAVRRIMLHLDDPERFVRLLEDLLARREQWLPFLARLRDRQGWLSSWSEHLESRARWPMEEVGPMPKEVRAWLERFGHTLAQEASLRTRLEACRFLARGLLKSDGTCYARTAGPHALRAIGVRPDDPQRKDVLQAWQDMHAAMAALGTWRSSWLRLVAHLPDPVPREEEWELLEAIVLVLARALEHLQAVFRDERRVDFTEITRLALLALGEDEAPTDLQLALDYRIRHLLVDEFQDTSLTHYVFLCRLVRGWAPGDGRTFFAVGDPMQSIYRFRQADVAVFLAVRRHRSLGDVRLEPLTLYRNFRSDPEVVGWVNRFARVFPSNDDLDRGNVSFVPAVAVRLPGTGAGVRVHWIAHPEEEATRLASLVAEGRSDVTRQAILLRMRRHAAPIVQALQSRAIPVRLIDIVALAALPAVEDLLMLAESLLHPADTRAWLSVLRAPWCGVSNATLASLRFDVADPPGIHLLSGADLDRVPREDLAAVEEVTAILARGVARVARHGLRPALEATWILLGGPATLAHDTEFLAVERFFDVLDDPELVELWRRDPARFETRVRSLSMDQDPRASGAVEILTIHGAKGLEWDEVFLPGLGRMTQRDEAPLLRWQELFERSDRALLLLAARPSGPSTPTPRTIPTTYDYLSEIERSRDESEIVRLAYVAATRAVRRLHVFLPRRSSSRRDDGRVTTLAQVFTRVAETEREQSESMSEHETASERSSHPAPVPPVMMQSRKRLVRPQQALRLVVTDDVSLHDDDEPMLARGEGTAESRLLGRVLHAILARLADRVPLPHDPDDQLPYARRLLATAGIVGSTATGLLDEIRDALTRVLTDRRGRWILARRADSRVEWEIDWHVPGGGIRRLRLDRVFHDRRGRCWIIDYKLGRCEEGQSLAAFLDAERERHRTQLETYARALRAYGESMPIHLGLYFPLLPRGWLGWRAPH